MRFEAEETIVALSKAINAEGNLSEIAGIAYRSGEGIVKTAARPLIKDLDSLPFPAFDLMPVEESTIDGWFFSNGIALEHSRGCIDRCVFCSLWPFWGKQEKTDIENEDLVVSPCYRTKSVERTLEEVDLVYKRYNKRFIFWPDAAFNADARWTEKFCEGLLKRGYKDLHWLAFMRVADLLRDERLGILEKMVKAGLVHVIVGVERRPVEDLKKVNKLIYSQDQVKELFLLLGRKYPHVFKNGSFVTCLPFDTRESMLDLVEYEKEIDLDHPIIHPTIAVPGTYLYQQAKAEGLLTIEDSSQCNWIMPVMRSYAGLTSKDFALLNIELNQRFFLTRPVWLIRKLLSPYKSIREGQWFFVMITMRMILEDLLCFVLGNKKGRMDSAFLRLRRPRWYDS